MPYPSLPQKEKESVVKVKSFKGDIYHSEDKTMVSFGELKIDYPRLNLSGELDISHPTQPASRKVNLGLKATNVNVNATRKIALVKAGEVSVVRDIFNIVKGGRIPFLTFTARGNSMKDLGALENIIIKGDMLDGEIFVPRVDLDLAEVKGDVGDR